MMRYSGVRVDSELIARKLATAYAMGVPVDRAGSKSRGVLSARSADATSDLLFFSCGSVPKKAAHKNTDRRCDKSQILKHGLCVLSLLLLDRRRRGGLVCELSMNWRGIDLFHAPATRTAGRRRHLLKLRKNHGAATIVFNLYIFLVGLRTGLGNGACVWRSLYRI